MRKEDMGPEQRTFLEEGGVNLQAYDGSVIFSERAAETQHLVPHILEVFGAFEKTLHAVL